MKPSFRIPSPATFSFASSAVLPAVLLISATFMGGCHRLTTPVPPKGVPAHAKLDKSTKQWVVTSKDGKQLRYFSNSRLAKKGQLKNKLPNGLWMHYARNGVMTARGAYDEGKKVGQWKYWDQSGRLYLEQRYAAEPINAPLFKLDAEYGTENGPYRRFYPDGRVEEQGSFKAGKYHGQQVKFFQDGKVAARGRFEADLRVGRWLYYYPEGNLEREENYRKGALQGVYRNYHPDGSLKQELLFEAGKEVPGSRKFHPRKSDS